MSLESSVIQLKKLWTSSFYPNIITGINIYNEIGFLAVSLKNSPYITKTKATTEQLKEPVDMEFLDHLDLQKRFPFLTINEKHAGLFSQDKSGCINPRNLIKAQKELAVRGGCQITNDIVKRVTPLGSEGYEVEVESSGHVIRGKKVLLTAGCFTESRNLLPKGIKLNMQAVTFTILLVCFPKFSISKIYTF